MEHHIVDLADLGVDVELLAQLAAERDRGIFSRLDLAAGQLPL